MTGWKRFKGLTAMKEVESVRVVANERRDPGRPAVRPGSTKGEFQLVLDGFRGQNANRAQPDDSLEFREMPPHEGGEAECNEDARGNERVRQSRRVDDCIRDMGARKHVV